MVSIKGASKDAKNYVERSMAIHNLLFSTHTLCMNNVTKRFTVQLLSQKFDQMFRFVHSQGPKRVNKEFKTKNLMRFHNHSHLLTM